VGGYGSGRHGWKPLAEGRLRLDVNRLHREGALKPGAVTFIYWQDSTIQTTSRPPELILSYTVAAGTDHAQSLSYAVPLSFTKCHYGGSRPWFICPSVTCNQRVGTLRRIGNYFLCRHCGDLAYLSQRLDLEERLRRRAEKIRVRLGCGGDRWADFPPKPKGLHWRTYRRLEAEHWELEDEAEHLARLSFVSTLARFNPMLAASIKQDVQKGDELGSGEQ
jgi:hypothetical protein